jgi:hypothetical protein
MSNLSMTKVLVLVGAAGIAGSPGTGLIHTT